MRSASFPPGAMKVISSWNPFCFRSKGMTSFSIARVNSATLLGFRYRDTLRAIMANSLIILCKRAILGNSSKFINSGEPPQSARYLTTVSELTLLVKENPR